MQIQSFLKYLGTKWPPRDKGLFGENVHAKSGKEVWDMINTLFVTTVAVEPTFVVILCTRKHYVRVPFFQISLKNSALKATRNYFRDCRVHFFRQPFLN